jgi:hypothetical protein
VALGQIPPWLQTNPQDFTQAAEGGAHLGLELGQQQQQVVQQVAARQQQAQQVAAQRAQQQQEFSENQQLDQERLAAQQAEAQQRLQLETQTAARKFQAQQSYQQALQSGQDPIQAMLQYGPQMGESMAGLGPLSLSETRMKQASVPPQPVNGPDGQPVGYTYGGNMHMLPRKAAVVPDKLNDFDKAQQLYYQKQLEEVDKEEAALPPDLEATKDSNDSARKSIEQRRQKAEQGLEDIEKEFKGDKGDDQKTAQGGYKIGATYKGGLKYLGGDPGDEASWQQVNSGTQ